jgi:2,3-bisphosphoglycerate-dependent phosphoglycerate mutase
MGIVGELILIRHGQSASNVAFPRADAVGAVESGLAGRDADVELTEFGVRQAEAVGRWLAALPVERLPEVAITSPYVRARETWRIAAEASGRELPEPVTDDRLVDRLLGDLEMLTQAAIAERFPGESARRVAAPTPYEYRPPNGEDFGDVATRLRSFVEHVNTEYAGKRVVVTAHDSVVIMARHVIEGLDWEATAEVESGGAVRNGSLTRFHAEGDRLVLDYYNTVDHLGPELTVAAPTWTPDPEQP